MPLTDITNTSRPPASHDPPRCMVAVKPQRCMRASSSKISKESTLALPTTTEVTPRSRSPQIRVTPSKNASPVSIPPTSTPQVPVTARQSINRLIIATPSPSRQPAQQKSGTSSIRNKASAPRSRSPQVRKPTGSQVVVKPNCARLIFAVTPSKTVTPSSSRLPKGKPAAPPKSPTDKSSPLPAIVTAWGTSESDRVIMATPSTSRQFTYSTPKTTRRLFEQDLYDLDLSLPRNAEYATPTSSIKPVQQTAKSPAGGAGDTRSSSTGGAQGLRSSLSSKQHATGVGSTVTTFKFDFHVRDYKTQRNEALVLGETSLEFTSCEDAVEKTWVLCEPHMKREIRRDTNRMWEWSDKILPTKTDMDRYVTIHATVRKVTLNVSSFFAKPSNYTREDIFIVAVVKYSSNVNTKVHFQEITKQLLKPEARDRAGAPDNVALAEIVVDLKARFGKKFRALEMNWSQWGDLVARKNVDDREAYINQGPPAELLTLFKSLPYQPAEVTLKNGREKTAFASNVNSGYKPFITGIVDDLMRLSQRVAQMETHHDATEKMLAEVNDTFTCKENAISREFLSKVMDDDDMEDLDHAEDVDNGVEEQQFNETF